MFKSTPFSSSSIVKFEQVKGDWVVCLNNIIS